MRWGRWVLGGFASIVVAGFAVHYFRPDLLSINVAPFAANCAKDDEIPKGDQALVAQAAVDFVNGLLGPTEAVAFERMSPASQASTKRAGMLDLAKQVRGLGPFTNEKVSRTYYVKVVAPGLEAGSNAPCGNFSRHAEWDTVKIQGAKDQAHVLITADSGPSEYTFAIWLVRLDRGWFINGFHVGPSRLAGRSADDMWRKAQSFRAKGDAVDASLSYAVANLLLERGPYFQPGLRNDFDKDRSTFSEPQDTKGAGPYHWILDGQPYTVTQLNVITTKGDGKLLLVINHDLAEWKSDRDADSRNRQLITSYIKAHPSWSDAFDALVAKASKPDHSGGYGTVYEKDKGFI